MAEESPAERTESAPEDGDGDSDTAPDVPEDREPVGDVPEWTDEYLDRVGDRLQFNYDLEKDYTAGREQFDLYGRLHIESQKQVLHQALNWANYETNEHLFARRADGVSVADLEALVDLGHDLADEWIEADEEHRETEFSFVVVAPSIPPAVEDYVEGFRDRTLLRYGYYGSYEVNLVVVAPDSERVVASTQADVAGAFDLWGTLGSEPRGVLGRLKRLLG